MGEPKYRVGDTVVIKKRLEYKGDYRFCFTDEMAEEAGNSFEIESVSEAGSPADKVPDDGYRYRLKGIRFFWASSMFEDPHESLSCIGELSDGSIDAFIRTKECPKLDFNL